MPAKGVRDLSAAHGRRTRRIRSRGRPPGVNPKVEDAGYDRREENDDHREH
jgi:hypothetical protein